MRRARLRADGAIGETIDFVTEVNFANIQDVTNEDTTTQHRQRRPDRLLRRLQERTRSSKTSASAISSSPLGWRIVPVQTLVLHGKVAGP